MLKYIFSILLFASILQATTISSQENNYAAGQSMTFTILDMSGDRDWIGIYPKGASNDWDNVIAWKWTQDIIHGSINFSSIDAGKYEARAFFHNSFHTEATVSFSVSSHQKSTTITTQKNRYKTNESITVNISNMAGNTDDWIAIYPAGSSNDWDNVITWRYTKGIKYGNINLGTLQAGSYEARAFFNNSYRLEARHKFTVIGKEIKHPSIKTQKEHYNAGESITVSLANMAGNNLDWVAIYPAGSSNDWDNVVTWKYTSGIKYGNINLGSLQAGSYQARAFFNNSFILKASHNFTVNAVRGSDEAKIFLIGDSTVHNANHGEMGWGTQLGNYMKHADNVYNRARAGASSKSYKPASNGHRDWVSTKSLIRSVNIDNGAYLFIQFGANDVAPDAARHTEPGRGNSYYNELKVYVNEARALGVTPVLITPPNRMHKGVRTNGQYPATMKYVAEDMNVLLLDLEERTYQEHLKFPNTAAILEEFSYDDFAHTNPHGAYIRAGWIKDMACHSGDQTLCSQF